MNFSIAKAARDARAVPEVACSEALAHGVSGLRVNASGATRHGASNPGLWLAK